MSQKELKAFIEQIIASDLDANTKMDAIINAVNSVRAEQ